MCPELCCELTSTQSTFLNFFRCSQFLDFDSKVWCIIDVVNISLLIIIKLFPKMVFHIDILSSTKIIFYIMFVFGKKKNTVYLGILCQ